MNEGSGPAAWRGGRATGLPPYRLARPPPSPHGSRGARDQGWPQSRRAGAQRTTLFRCSPLATSHSAALPQVLQDFFFFQGASSLSLRWLLLFIMSSVPTSEPLAIFLDVGGVPEIEL